jgi:hypothetical protein
MRVEQVANNVFNLIIGTMLGVAGTALFLLGISALAIIFLKLVC